MKQMHAKEVTISVVESIMPKNSPENLGLHIGLHITAENFETDYYYNKYLDYLFIRSSNFTQVYLNVNEKTFPPNVLKMDLQSYHDSCWKSDGLIKIFEVWKEAHKHFTKKIDGRISFRPEGIGYYEIEKKGIVRKAEIQFLRRLTIGEASNLFYRKENI